MADHFIDRPSATLTGPRDSPAGITGLLQKRRFRQRRPFFLAPHRNQGTRQRRYARLGRGVLLIRLTACGNLCGKGPAGMAARSALIPRSHQPPGSTFRTRSVT